MINPRPYTKNVPAAGEEKKDAIRSLYLESLQLVERLHRRLLDVIKDEFDRNGRSDINAIQALLLFNIGNAELTAGELRSRGYYLGSNVSYNLKKLVDLGFPNLFGQKMSVIASHAFVAALYVVFRVALFFQRRAAR